MTVDNRTKRPRGRPPSISRVQILEAAHSLPFAELTMPAVAKILDVKTPALYHHFKNRNELLRTIGQDLIQGFEVSAGDPQQWREWLFDMACDFAAYLADHPALLVAEDSSGPGFRISLHASEAVLETLEGAGFPLLESTHIWRLLAGHIYLEANRRFRATHPDYADLLTASKASMESYRLETPRTYAWLNEFDVEHAKQTFEQHLRWFIEMIPEPARRQKRKSDRPA